MLGSAYMHGCLIMVGDFFAGRGRERIFLHGTVNWMCAKHSHLGRSGGMPPRIFLEIYCSKLMGLGTYSIPTLVSKMGFNYKKPIHVCCTLFLCAKKILYPVVACYYY